MSEQNNSNSSPPAPLELINNSDTNSFDTATNNPQPIETNEQKKIKLDSNNIHNNNEAEKNNNNNRVASRVIHIRNIPSDVNETEIVHLGIPFGRVSNVLVLKGKNQAFLEMADLSNAVSMVNYFGNCMAQLRGRSVYVQYSTHKELKTDLTHSNANQQAQAALQAAQLFVKSEGGQGFVPSQNSGPLLSMDSSSTSSSTTGGPGGGGPNTVLRVIVEQMLYPVTLETLYQIFSRIGKVLKIVTFTKNGFFQALIQYPDVVSSQAAQLTLDGQNIYNGCCTLRIEFSKLQSLSVRYNNDKSRDFTNSSLPSGDTTSLESNFNFQPNPAGFFRNDLNSLASLNSLTNSRIGWNQNPLSHLQQFQAGAGLHVNSAAIANLMGGNPVLGGLNLNGSAVGGTGAVGCVLLVSNLPETLSPDNLFTLFGVYGDVVRVKILFNKKDSALIQMAQANQAQLALQFLDRLKLEQKIIRVTISKHTNVQMPKEGQPDAGLTKDFTNSPLHRFKKPDSKNYQNIYAPSATLHISNIPSNVSEEEIVEAFKQKGFETKGFKFFPKDRKMALIAMDSIEQAALGLMALHNFKIRESANLRVSFSKSTI